MRGSVNLTNPDENYPCLKMISSEGGWEIGLMPVLFGTRVRLSQVGNEWVTLDYCAGDDFDFALRLLAAVTAILEDYPETVSERTLQDTFPRYEIKPINRDPFCWKRLQEMAGLN